MNSEAKEQQSAPLSQRWMTTDGSAWWLRSSPYMAPTGDYSANCYLDLLGNPANANSVTFKDNSCNYHSKSYYCQPIKMSLKPKVGSPTGCTCKKVELTGAYSAQILIECEKCLDVYRSKDKNSCPSGTKLFSPRTRADWKTFLSSAQPLRSPNWIVDVTRPQNGCGGCTSHAMSSTTAPQATWVTSDGSPWWFRSSTYSQPNGDYHANCYSDLWHKPKNEDSITWNDGSCSYHAKSYYCQLAKLSLKPKPGSPTGCVCENVALTGKYSAKMLIKCKSCLDVRKSTQKNSCPMGTKLFSPASRADWKVFIDSAKPLRSPHWIIDVTRPQNGCGGCTASPMT